MQIHDRHDCFPSNLIILLQQKLLGWMKVVNVLLQLTKKNVLNIHYIHMVYYVKQIAIDRPMTPMHRRPKICLRRAKRRKERQTPAIQPDKLSSFLVNFHSCSNNEEITYFCFWFNSVFCSERLYSPLSLCVYIRSEASYLCRK